MNLRIHKKLSKRAAPLLELLGDKREQFKADKHGCYFGNGRLYPCDRKHWDRDRALYPFDDSCKVRPRHDKHWVVLRHPDQPMKGTVMVGEISGYYEPEWEEETAWESLCRLVEDHYTEFHEPHSFDEETGYPNFILMRDLSSPKLILRAAMDMLNEKGGA